MTTRPTILMAGALAENPYGGHTWVFLQYMLGFRRLGFDVLLVDRGGEAARARLRAVLEPFGLYDGFEVLNGATRLRLIDAARSSLVFINVMGYVNDEEVLAAARKRVFLDIDPGFGQMWYQLGQADILSGHDAYFTFGANTGRPDCAVPRCGRNWIATRPPVVLEHWPVAHGEAGFTTVGAWRGPFDPIEYKGTKYGLRVHEFRKFARLPNLTSRRFEMALDIHPADDADRKLLEEGGWSLVEPKKVTGNTFQYRRYIQRSSAEFGVAKNMYVQARTGWFSDRSACYLASGKPVLFEDTGIRSLFPTGEGLLTYSTLEEAADKVEEICGDYRRHSHAARAIAEEYFDSDKVLSAFLERVRD